MLIEERAEQAISRRWVIDAIQQIERDAQRSSDTHLVLIELPAMPQVRLYMKDESTHATGSLKHRLARSLFLHALCNGWINEQTTVIDASSGSTAVSEAYFARLLGLRFVAVMPRNTSLVKVAQIQFYGGQCHFIDNPAEVCIEAARLARETGGHFMDQFTYAERATDWRGNNNIAESIFQQMRGEPHPVPRWIVVGAGTGGTSATIGRYIRYRGADTQLCVVDPDHSVFYEYYQRGDSSITSDRSSDIEGIGRPRVEASFLPGVIDRMIHVPNAASYAAMRFLEQIVGRKYGGSTGTDFYGSMQIACEMAARGEDGAIVMLAGDLGDRYLDTYYSDSWLSANGYDIRPHTERLSHAYATATWAS